MLCVEQTNEIKTSHSLATTKDQRFVTLLVQYFILRMVDKMSNSSLSTRTLSISDRDRLDESILLSNANRLLAAVGVNSKQILTAKELARVASSMFVAVLESLFHTRIAGVNRNPQCKSDYEENAQLVIDYLSDRIEMDLKHISGTSIANGDLTSISNLVHILVRIVSITRWV